jgi:hypothetical protein
MKNFLSLCKSFDPFAVKNTILPFWRQINSRLKSLWPKSGIIIILDATSKMHLWCLLQFGFCRQNLKFSFPLQILCVLGGKKNHPLVLAAD